MILNVLNLFLPKSCSCLGLNCLCLSHRDTFTSWGAALMSNLILVAYIPKLIKEH